MKRPFEFGYVYGWLIALMPSSFKVNSDQSPRSKPFVFAAYGIWKLFSALVDLACRWARHAAAEFWSSRGYTAFGVVIAAYAFCYSLANEAYQRGELNASLKLSNFLTSVSGGNRPSFIAAIKDFSTVQNAESYEPPAFWPPTTWLQSTPPNRVFLRDWAKAIFEKCEEKDCGVDSYRIDLRSARLDRTRLWAVDFNRSDLTGVSAVQAELTSANFQRANISNGNFFRAYLQGADFRDATLQCARLERVQGAYVDGGIEGPDTATQFDRADMRGVTADRAKFERATFDGVDMTPVRCYGGVFPLSQITDCEANGASFREAKLADVDFRKSRLRGATFIGADLANANLGGTDLRGANFEKATLSGATLAGAIYSTATKWPDGFDPQQAGAQLQDSPPIEKRS